MEQHAKVLERGADGEDEIVDSAEDWQHGFPSVRASRRRSRPSTTKSADRALSTDRRRQEQLFCGLLPSPVSMSNVFDGVWRVQDMQPMVRPRELYARVTPLA